MLSTIFLPFRPHTGFGEVKWFTDHIEVLPRGTRFQMFGADKKAKTFLSLGVAPSIDAIHRTPGINWWGAEQITWADVAAVETVAAQQGSVDYMFTHDAPETVAPRIAAIIGRNRDSKYDPIIGYCAEGRRRLTNAFNAVQPKVLLTPLFLM